MLSELIPKLCCPCCFDADHPLASKVFTEGTNGHIADGVLVCEGCRAWYPIQSDVLELIDWALLDPQDHAAFCSRFERQLAALELRCNPQQEGPSGHQCEQSLRPQLKQREFFDRFADLREVAYADYHNQAF